MLIEWMTSQGSSSYCVLLYGHNQLLVPRPPLHSSTKACKRWCKADLITQVCMGGMWEAVTVHVQRLHTGVVPLT